MCFSEDPALQTYKLNILWRLYTPQKKKSIYSSTSISQSGC